MIPVAENNAELQGAPGFRSLLTDDERWTAVLARNANYDGAFVLAVRSTGIYCRPSCPARHPVRDQAVFFARPSEAEKSGFRPCRRCRPENSLSSPRSGMIDRLCKHIETNLNKKLTLRTLSIEAGVSPFHLQRTFKRVLGISPRQYVDARRLEKMKRSLRRGETVSNSLYNAGFTSRSRIYEKVPDRLGVSPGTLRRGGQGLRVDYTILDSPLGRLLIGATERGICAVCMGDSDAVVEAALYEDYPAADLHRSDEAMQKWATAFTNYFTGRQFPLDLPVDVQATAFQRRVWKEIRSIPYGSTTTYSKIAETLGSPRGARAVARACATNPTSLVVPCHRVVGEDGRLRGYRWGVKRKQALLGLERGLWNPIA